MALINVKPAPGILVRIPERDWRPMDAAGEAVPDTYYWLRRLADGDVVRVEEAPAAPAAPAATSKKK